MQHYLRLAALPESEAYKTVYDESIKPLFQNENSRTPMGVTMERTSRDLSLTPIRILACQTLNEPRYLLSDIVCPHLLTTKKSTLSSNQLRQLFLDHIHTYHTDSYHIYTDGSRSDDGSGSGVFSDHISKSIKLSPIASSFTAELYAILEAVIHLSNHIFHRCTIFSDSLSSIYLLNNISSNHPILAEIHSYLFRLKSIGRTVQFCWVPAHVGIYGNDEADRLAGEAALSDGAIDRTLVPHKDYYPLIRSKIYDIWQRDWSNTPQTNKLRYIRDTTKNWSSSSQRVRYHSVILTRLRIGHCRISHGYLMTGQLVPPYCDSCIVPLTVRHFLEECPDYNHIRGNLFGPNCTINTILAEPQTGRYDITPLIRFLSEINVLNNI